MSAVVVNIASPLEFNAVSIESCITLMMKPTATACMAISPDIPKREHAIGISRSDPPATPDVPHAPKVARILKMMAWTKLTSMPKVLHTANVMTVMVTEAPSILMVDPNGILTE